MVTPPRGSQSAARACEVLYTLAGEQRPQTLSEVAGQLHLAKSSALGILTSLEANGFVRRVEAGYSLDSGVLRLAGGYLNAYNVVDEFRHAVTEFPTLRREIVQLATRSGREVLYLARHTGRAPLFVSATPGDSFPASITAVGNALLAPLTDDEISALYTAPDHFDRWTSESTTELPRLLDKIHATRRRGYGLDEGETNPEVVGLAVLVQRTGRHTTPLAIGAALRRPDAGSERWEQVVSELNDLRDILESGNRLS